MPKTSSEAVYVESEQDIVAAVLGARRSSRTLRCVGSAGSKNGSFFSPGIELHFGAYDRVLSVEDGQVVAQAGVTVGGLNRVLEAHGLALPTHGEWAGATLAGAVATATHGGSGTHGIFPTSLRSMRIVTGDGETIEVVRENEDFPHLGVSLGALGVTSTLTFQCEEKFFLQMETRVVPFDRYLSTLEAHTAEHEFYSALWVPNIGRVITFAANRTPEPPATVHHSERYSIKNCVLATLAHALHLDLLPRRWIERTAAGSCHQILSPIRSEAKRVKAAHAMDKRWKAVEFALPLSRVVDSFPVIEEFLARHQPILSLPVGLRATAGDDFTLSPCNGRASFWFDMFFWADTRFAHGLTDLFGELGARCHWGKYLALPSDHLRAQYPGWQAFWNARDRYDPERVFANEYLQNLEP